MVINQKPIRFGASILSVCEINIPWVQWMCLSDSSLQTESERSSHWLFRIGKVEKKAFWQLDKLLFGDTLVWHLTTNQGRVCLHGGTNIPLEQAFDK